MTFNCLLFFQNEFDTMQLRNTRSEIADYRRNI